MYDVPLIYSISHFAGQSGCIVYSLEIGSWCWRNILRLRTILEVFRRRVLRGPRGTTERCAIHPVKLQRSPTMGGLPVEGGSNL